MLIVQISDFHLLPRGELAYKAADTASALGKVVDHINGLVPMPDVVIVTGDVADGGRLDSYHLARELLAPLEMPVFMVPGNHDHKGRMAKVFSDHSYLRPNPGSPIGDFICYTIEEFPVRLIALDTVTPGDHGGGLGPRRLAWLEATLLERPDVPTLIFMHHPPFPSAVGHMDLEPFKHRKDLSKLIQCHSQVERLTCGHIHRSISLRFGGSVATVCPGVGMQIPMDLRPEAPSGFILGPAGILVHCFNDSWEDSPILLTHCDLVEDFQGQFGTFNPFFDVENPK